MVLEKGMDVTKLIDEVRDWLHSKPGPITRKAIELEVSYFWLQRFMKGRQDNITTDRLQMLVARMHAEQAPKKSRPRENTLNPRV